eukprot:3920451-Amphidinium_carterae.1
MSGRAGGSSPSVTCQAPMTPLSGSLSLILPRTIQGWRMETQSHRMCGKGGATICLTLPQTCGQDLGDMARSSAVCATSLGKNGGEWNLRKA